MDSQNCLGLGAEDLGGGKASYRYGDLRSRGPIIGHRLIQAVRAAQVDLGEVEGVVVVVSDFKAGDGIGQLAGEVEVGRAVVGHEEDAVTGSTAGDGGERLQLGEAEPALVDRIQADDVRAQIRDEEVLTCGIEQGLVRMGRILPVRDWSGGIEGVCLGLDRCERTRIRDVKRGYRGPGASRRGTTLVVNPVCTSCFSSGDGRASAYPLLPREWLDSVTLAPCSRGEAACSE